MTNNTDTQPPKILFCGHPATKTEGVGTGYAILPDDTAVCYDCADQWQRDQMKISNEVIAYVSSDSKNITTWSGGELMKISQIGSSRSGWYGSKIFYVQAVAPDGSRWYGRNGGEGMSIKMKRNKTA